MKLAPRRLAFTVVGLTTICYAVLWLGLSVMVLVDPALAFDGNSFGAPPSRHASSLGCLASVVLLYVGRHVFSCRNTRLHWPVAVLTTTRISIRLLRKIQPKIVLRWIIRTALALLILAATLAGYALLPGSIEGNYQQNTCMCDSFNFIQYRDGNLISYSCGHRLAQWMGRYEQSSDGSIHVLLRPADSTKPEVLICRAYPHRLVTQFVSTEDGTVSWHLKRPLFGKAMATCLNQEITTITIHPDKAVTLTFFDRDFKQLREEHKQPRKK